MSNENKNGGGKWKFLAMLGAVAAGLYYFTGKDASRRRQKAKETYTKVTEKASGKIERTKKQISKIGYYTTIEDVLLKYEDRAKNISREELHNLRDELQEAWQDIRDESEESALEERSGVRLTRE